MSKKAFITGITGQDGSYLAEFLLQKEYEVAGLVRSKNSEELENIKSIASQVKLYIGDLTRVDSIKSAIENFKPEEIYNLAGLSSPFGSFADKLSSIMVSGVGALHVFEVAKQVVPSAKIFQASSSEMYGVTTGGQQNETTPFNPVTPYAAAKEYAHRMAVIARVNSKQPQFISCGIMFNHESPRRGLKFVTRKITAAVACIKLDKKDNIPLNELGEPIIKDGKLHLGNLDAKRDWGYAKEYVEAMWLMLQQDQADDFVVATGELHSVKDFCQEAFAVAGLNWQDHVVSDPKFIPPIQSGPLWGNPAKANRVLKWRAKTSFEELVRVMVEADLERFSHKIALAS